MPIGWLNLSPCRKSAPRSQLTIIIEHVPILLVSIELEIGVSLQQFFLLGLTGDVILDILAHKTPIIAIIVSILGRSDLDVRILQARL